MPSSRLAGAVLQMSADASAFFSDIDKVEKRVGGLGLKLKKIGASASRAGRALSLGVTTPLAAFGAAAFKASAEAEETANKFDVVMGPAADGVRQRLDDLTSTIPLTRSEMEGLAAGIQDMLVPMGVARTDAAGMSADMVELAGDMAAFNNASPDQVLQDIQSALAGSSEPMRKYGVDTRVAALESVALAHGLIEQGEELDNTTRAQAVLLAIQKDSTDAMGAAKREAEGNAASVRFLWRNVKDLTQSFGDELVPAITPVIQRLADAVKWFGSLEKGTKSAIVQVGGFVAALGPGLFALGKLTTGIGGGIRGLRDFSGWLRKSTIAKKAATAAQWLLNVALNANPLGLVVLAVGALVGAWALWGDEIKGFLSGAWNAWLTAVETAIDYTIRAGPTSTGRCSRVKVTLVDARRRSLPTRSPAAAPTVPMHYWIRRRPSWPRARTPATPPGSALLLLVLLGLCHQNQAGKAIGLILIKELVVVVQAVQICLPVLVTLERHRRI